MTENVKKIITFTPGEGNKPFKVYLWTKTLNSYHFRLFSVVKLKLADNKDRTTPIPYTTICK